MRADDCEDETPTSGGGGCAVGQGDSSVSRLRLVPRDSSCLRGAWEKKMRLMGEKKCV